MIRFWLGMAQMAAATVAVVLLFETGLSRLALLAVIGACTFTTISVVLFGSVRNDRAAPSGDRGR